MKRLPSKQCSIDRRLVPVRTVRVPGVPRSQCRCRSASRLRQRRSRTTARRRSREVLVDDGAASKRFPLDSLPARDDAANRVTGLGVYTQRLIDHALDDFETRGLRTVARYGLVDIGRHVVCLSRSLQSFAAPIIVVNSNALHNNRRRSAGRERGRYSSLNRHRQTMRAAGRRRYTATAVASKLLDKRHSKGVRSDCTAQDRKSGNRDRLECLATCI